MTASGGKSYWARRVRQGVKPPRTHTVEALRADNRRPEATVLLVQEVVDHRERNVGREHCREKGVGVLCG